MPRTITLLIAAAISCPQVPALAQREPTTPNQSEQHRLEIRVQSENRIYVLLECRASTFNLRINWGQRVGKHGEKLRHLFYHLDGDKHLMLPVLDTLGRTTGYVSQSAKAKSLVTAILRSVRKDSIPIGVFPAERDPIAGEWINGWLPAATFKEAAIRVGKKCQWDPTTGDSAAYESDNISPASPYR